MLQHPLATSPTYPAGVSGGLVAVNLVAVTRAPARPGTLRPETQRSEAILPGPILPGLSLLTLDAAGLRAHVVPLEPSARGILESALADPERTRDLVLAHAAVVDALGRAGPVVPFRLPSLVADTAAVTTLLERHRGALDACLDRVDCCDEWGLRVILDETATEAEPEPLAGSAGGAAFLRGRLAAREQRRATAVARADAVAAVHSALAAHARSTDTPDLEPRPVPGGRCVLRASFLVPREAAQAFTDAARRQGEVVTAAGLRLALGGPFPPYSFVTDALELPRAAA